MPRKTSKPKTISKTKIKKESKVTKKPTLDEELSRIKEDKMFKKVERYVDKNREKTSKEIAERKKSNSAKKYQEADLEVMISRINTESKPKEKTKEISKRIVNILYIIIILAILIFVVKYFFPGKVSQIS